MDIQLRDYLAAKAMQSILPEYNSGKGTTGVNGFEHTIAIDAYIYADAMLKARENKQP